VVRLSAAGCDVRGLVIEGSGTGKSNVMDAGAQRPRFGHALVHRRPRVAIDSGTVRITMTMTSLSCPLRYYLQDVMESTVMLCLSGAARVIVDIVSSPPWTREMMSPAARAQLGLLCGSPRGC